MALAECKCCYEFIPVSLYNLLVARAPEDEAFICPVCRIRSYMTEIASIQELLQQRGSVLLSRHLPWKIGEETHKELTVQRWRAVKIKLMQDVIRYEELAQSLHRERADWTMLDEALRLWEENNESLAEVPMDIRWSPKRDCWVEQARHDSRSGHRVGKDGWEITQDVVAQRIKRKNEKAERHEEREVKRAKKAGTTATEKEEEDQIVLVLKRGSDPKDGSQARMEIYRKTMDANGAVVLTEIHDLKGTDMYNRLQDTGSTASKEENSSKMPQQVVQENGTPSPLAPAPDVELEDIETDSDEGATMVTAEKPAAVDRVRNMKGEAASTSLEEASPDIHTTPPATSSPPRKHAASSELSRSKRVQFSDIVTVSPERLNCAPTLFPGLGLSLDPPDSTQALRLTATEIQARATKPLSSEDTYQSHSDYVWRKLRRGSRKFCRNHSAYTPGRWASPAGYEKVNTSYYHIDWDVAEGAWAKEEQEEADERKVFENLKTISGAYVLFRVLPAAFWCYQQAKMAEVADLVAGIRLPVEEDGEEMQY